MRERLSNFLQLLSKENGILIFLIIFIPLWMGIFILLFSKAGAFNPPTEEDYKYLHEQEEKLKEDFESVYLIEGASIKNINSEIKVVLISEVDSNYELHIVFDGNKKFIKSEEICNKEGFKKNSLTGKYEGKGPIVSIILGAVFEGFLNSLLVWEVYTMIYACVINRNKKQH